MTIVSSTYDASLRRYTSVTEFTPKVGIIGCSGTNDPQAHYNLQILAQLAVDEKLDGIIVNGDNVYGPQDSGLSIGAQLRSQIVDPLGPANCPIFFGVGNHEMEIHSAFYDDAIDQIKKLKPAGISRLLIGTNWPALAWYRNKIRYGVLNAKKLQTFLKPFQAHGDLSFDNPPDNPRLNHANTSVQKFNMPEGGYYSQFYTPQGGSPSIEYIMVNTNTLPYDESQRRWLIDCINVSTADRIVIVGHHPMIEKTLGKRRYKGDGYMYAEAMAELAALEKKTDSEKTQARKEIWTRFEILHGLAGSGHGDQLRYVWNNEITPSLWINKDKIVGSIAAHDHFTAMVGNQVTLGGGGGGKLDKPVYDDPLCTYKDKISAFGIQEVVNGSLRTRVLRGLEDQEVTEITLFRQSVSSSNDTIPTQVEIELSELEKKLDLLAVNIGLGNITSQGFEKLIYDKKVSYDMLIALRDFMYDMRKKAAASLKHHEPIIQLARLLNNIVNTFNNKLNSGTQLQLDASMQQSIKELKELMDKQSNNGIARGVVLPMLLVSILFVALLKLFFGPRVVFDTPQLSLSTGSEVVLLAVVLWLGQMAGRVQYASVKSEFEVRLNHTQRIVLNTIDAVKAPAATISNVFEMK